MVDRSPAGWHRPAALALLLLIFLLLGDRHLGPLPAPGRFFNPFTGFWANADADRMRDGELRLPGLHDPVWAVFDRRRVPHLFAQNDHDLFYAQGYVTARDRLWQMEIQTHAAAGRLAEVLGSDLLEHDRLQRRLGMLQGALGDLEAMRKDRDAWAAAEAYCDGVNAYISSLEPGDYPVEYKLLGYAPEAYTPLKIALLIKNMQWTLSGGGDDLPMSNTLAKFGPEFMRRFFPWSDGAVEPVIPAGTAWTVSGDPLAARRTAAAPRPQAASGNARVTGDIRKARPDFAPGPVLPVRPDPGNGSNNFVLSGARTRSGYPLLANDPHLDLSLPSLWYEIQLAAPGFNAYGVSLPGAPAVVIGFNRKIAWGLTNGNDDVLDWYQMHFKDSTLSEYLYDRQWRPTRKVVEAIRVRGEGIVHDTVIYTHQGPLVLKPLERPVNRNMPILHALRWLALEPSDELQAFLGMLKADDYREFAAAIRAFKCPSQNFAFAAVDGDIAMEHHGLFPDKWPGQGRFTLNGEEAGNDWKPWIPMDENPRSRNPPRGWLASANQSPTDSSYPHYLGAGFLNGERAKRLAQLVARADSTDIASAWRILLDDSDLHAAEVLPTLLAQLKGGVYPPEDSTALALLTAWDFRHGPAEKAPPLFDVWWHLLYRSIWQDEFADDTLHYQWPSKDQTRRLILEAPDEDWFDDVTTPGRETLAILARRSFHEACALLRGSGRGNRQVTWSEYRPVDIRHLARIDAFSRLGLATGGCADCVDAQKQAHGPSWRMVVALGKTPRARGIYPGGQSGNPGSPHYDEFVDDWARGSAYDLLYLQEPDDPALKDAPGRGAAYRLLLKGK